MKPKIRVCVVGRNTGAFVEECLYSILSQKVQSDDVVLGAENGFTIDWTDDASEDDSVEKAERILLGSDDLGQATTAQICKVKARRGGCENLFRAWHRAGDDEVLLMMGGDDRLLPGALARVLREYEDPECWVTYGNFENSDGRITNKVAAWEPVPVCRRCNCRLNEKLTSEVLREGKCGGGTPEGEKLFGNAKHEVSYVHATRPPKEFVFTPFTCRAWLAKKVLERDLLLAGSFFPSSADVAMNIPIVEMAGPERCRLIEDKWYWRRIHPGNDGWVDPSHQHYCTFKALQKPRYGRIHSRDEVPTRSPHVLPYALILMPNEPFPRFFALDEWAANEVALGHVMPVDASLDFRRSPRSAEHFWDGEFVDEGGNEGRLPP